MKRTWVLTFVLFTLTPAAAWIAGLEVNLDLRRTGYPFPRPAVRALLQRDYYQALDRYFNEHLALRDPLVWGKNWLDRYLFRMSGNPEVHLGRDGWLYRRKDILDRRAETARDPAAIRRLLLELHAVEKLTEASGRRFVFAVVPSKASLYPEHIGWSLPAGGAVENAYDQLRIAMQESPLPGFLPLEDWMRAHKIENRLLYDKDGAYWNRRGAAVAAEAWYRHLFAADTIRPVLPGGRDDGEDLARELMGRGTPTALGGPLRYAGGAPSAWGQSLLYDSGAASHLIDHLQTFVPRLDVIAGLDWPSKAGENPRDYDSLMLLVAEAEVADLRIDFDRLAYLLEGEAVQALRTAIDRPALAPLAQAALQRGPEGLALKSLGRESQFRLDGLPGSDSACFRILKLHLTGRQPESMTFAFDAPQALSLQRWAHPGRFTCYLPLPFAPRVDLRWQPGTRPGLLLLQGVEIMALPQIGTRPSRALDSIPDTAVPAAPPGMAARNALPRVAPQPTAAAGDTKAADKALGGGGQPRSHSVPIRSAPPQDRSPLAIDRPMKAETPVIRLSDIAEGRIFQRRGRSAEIVVSGTWQGAVAGIEARVVDARDQREVVPWVLVDAAPQNGLFLGTLPAVPQGGWYNLQIRDLRDHTVLVEGTHRWGVGLLVACLGQSNMKEWFYAGSDLEAHPLLRMQTPAGWATLERTGDGAIAFGNRLIEATGIPVGLLDYAVNGSGLLRQADWGAGYWEDRTPDSIYERFREAVAALGGSLEFVIWNQGEADAARGTVTREAYAAALERFVTGQLRADITNAATQAHLPVLIVSMVRRPGGKDGPHQAIREAQHGAVRRLPECYLAATTLDLPLMGKQHLTPEAYRTMGQRVAQTALFLLGRAAYYRGPRFEMLQRVDAATLDFVLRHQGGSDILPENDLTGWQITQNGQPCAIDRVDRHDHRTVRLVLAEPLTGPATASYLYGAMPDVRRPVRDNSPLSLPLEAFRIDVPSRDIKARAAR